MHENDLVVATQGRSFWILDDLTPLHQLTDEVAQAESFLFRPRSAYRMGGGISFTGGGTSGKNPPNGAVFHYLLGEELGKEEDDLELLLEVLDAEGNVLRDWSSKKPERKAYSPWREFIPELGKPSLLETKQGMNRFVWDLRLPDAEIQEKAILWGAARGPRVPPGSYSVRLTLGEWSATERFQVLKDPRIPTTQEEMEQQYAFAQEVLAALNESHAALGRLRDVRAQVEGLTERLQAGEELEAIAGEVTEKLGAIEVELHQTKSEAGQDILNYTPQLDNQLLALLGDVETGDVPPTVGMIELYGDLRAELDAHLESLQSVFDGELARFNEAVRARTADAVIVGE